MENDFNSFDLVPGDKLTLETDEGKKVVIFSDSLCTVTVVFHNVQI